MDVLSQFELGTFNPYLRDHLIERKTPELAVTLTRCFVGDVGANV